MHFFKTEKRPANQIKTVQHAKKVPEDPKEGFRKLKRMKAQQEEWEELENKGQMPAAWKVKKKRGPYKKKPKDSETPAKRKASQEKKPRKKRKLKN